MSLAVRTFQDFCAIGNLSEILYHVKHGELLNWKDDFATTALQICAAKGWKEAVTALLEHGADTELCNSFGWTPLMHAARNGHSAIVEQLVLAGSNTAARNSYGWDALSLAVASGNVETISILIPLTEPSHLNKALLVSCQVGCISSTKLLIDNNVDVNTQMPSSGVTPLMLAASEGNKSMVELLLSHGANPDMRSSMDITALDVAVCCGHKDIQERLTLVTNLRQEFSMSNPTAFDSQCPSTPRCVDSASFIKHPSSLFPTNEYRPGYSEPYINGQLNQKKTLLSPYSVTPQHFVCLSPVSPHNFPLPSPNILTPCFEFPSPNSATHNYFHPSCRAEGYPSSPLIPGWIYSLSPAPPPPPPIHHHHHHHHHGQSSLTHASVLKNSKRVWRWWKKIKRRCKRKQHGVKVHVSYKGEALEDQQQLKALLKAFNLQALLPALQAHEIDVKSFLGLSDEDLKELGISDNTYRAEVLRKIKHLNEAHNSQEKDVL